MGASVMKSSRAVLATLVMAVILLGTCASGANAALSVFNDLKTTITVLDLPGCCNFGVCKRCPPVCRVCPNVVIESGKNATLNSHVGPYPLPNLKIQVQNLTYCEAETDLQYLTSTTLLRVGSGNCGKPFPQPIAAIIVNGSDRRVTCFQPCS